MALRCHDLAAQVELLESPLLCRAPERGPGDRESKRIDSRKDSPRAVAKCLPTFRPGAKALGAEKRAYRKPKSRSSGQAINLGLVYVERPLLGRYAFSVSEAVQRGELRPLRSPTESIDEVA